MMNLVMTSAPLAMVGCGHSVTEATLGIQWHVLGMYAPSFITGSLIVRYRRRPHRGARTCHAARFRFRRHCRITVAHFWISLTLLGVGWNFAFIGATTMVARSPPPGGANKVQSFNDFLIFGSMALGSLASGMILATFGWSRSTASCFRRSLRPAALLLWLMIRERRQVAG